MDMMASLTGKIDITVILVGGEGANNQSIGPQRT